MNEQVIEGVTHIAISILHAFDGVIALLIGLGFYFESNLLVTIGVIGITKFFLLYLLSRMVTGKKSHNRWSMILQTTKTFLHHTASFFFVSNRNAILLTSVWRFVSMNGHAAMTFRSKLTEKQYNSLMWKITHARNTVLLFVLLTCFARGDVRRGFGDFFFSYFFIVVFFLVLLFSFFIQYVDALLIYILFLFNFLFLLCTASSAIGHFSYMIVRLGPVYKLGSLYLISDEEKQKWQKISDFERLKILCSREGNFLFFGIEVGLLLFACVYFLLLRLSTVLVIVPSLDNSRCLFL
jgi:hypothetical protein